ncbi:putative membrane protein YedE/YeeE [Paraburkholderia atlantica]|uniref:DUF6691 family protein n=1 Tax=Paraburkholderia atlantica TaxID=2654982 RepID=UPI00128E8632|nr:DUF6691 family protein [Paraburkholderia atlantica]MBB5417285.1 hypothetical protein [Paraburkholderia atlantica]MPW11095.1 YeeE/YedE family protein [Paraburkholderia atlantica]
MNALKQLTAFGCGLLFGVGLALSGMTRPEKVLGFLDVTGQWDGSLLFVLGGAVVTAMVAFHFILNRHTPLLGERIDLPKETSVDRKLIVGAVIFGIGWGAVGYCPGPAIALLAQPNVEAVYFLPSMIAGWGMYSLNSSKLKKSAHNQ